jgi:hypothetical protein
MSEKSGNFLGGFILGTLVGSALGVVLGSKLNEVLSNHDLSDEQISDKNEIDQSEEPKIKAKRTLEQKIAQLNSAIDAVSHELSVSQTNGQKKMG